MDYKAFRLWTGPVQHYLSGRPVWQRVRQCGSLILLAAALTLTGWCASFLIGAVDLGPELSDSAFYILMRTEYAETRNMLTGFGVLLAALAGDSGLQATRFGTMLVTFAMPVLFLSIAWFSSLPSGNRTLQVAAIAVAGCAGFVPYKSLLLDPNYNSLTSPAVFLATLGLWQLWGEIRRPVGPHPVWTFLWAALTGVGVFCLCLLKISSGAVFVSVALPILVLASAIDAQVPPLRALRGTAFLAVPVLAGVAGMLGFLSIRTLPLAELWERAQTGLHLMGLLGSHQQSIGDYLYAFADALGRLLRVLADSSFWPLLPVACIAQLYFFGSRLPNSVRVGAAMIAILAMLAGILLQLGTFQDLALTIWIQALLISTLVLIPKDRDLRPALFALLFAWAPYGLSFGTNNVLIQHATQFSGAAVVAIFLAALAAPQVREVLLTCGILLGGGLTISALTYGERQPYRMQGPLYDATELFDVGGERWRVTPPLAGSYRVMQEIRESEEWSEAHSTGRPVLLDMTGRAPALNWLGNFRVPATPWVLSGYPGSADLLAWALAHTTDPDLTTMWIAVDSPGPDGTRSGLPIDILNERLAAIGLVFPQDYVIVGTEIPIAYMGQSAIMYMPRAFARVRTH